MGKGDKKSKRGKIVIGSYGVRRARKKRNGPAATSTPGASGQNIEMEVELKKAAKKKESVEVSEEKPKVAKPKKKSSSGEAGESIVQE